MTIRMLPPPNQTQMTIVINGRSYTAAANGTVDMPDPDAVIATASGWIPYPAHGATVGATAARPTANPNGTRPVYAGTQFYDTTLSKALVADGIGNFRDASGAVV